MFSPSKMFLNFFFAHENMKKPASKVAKLAQIQPKSQFLFHKNLPPRDFSLMTLANSITTYLPKVNGKPFQLYGWDPPKYKSE